MNALRAAPLLAALVVACGTTSGVRVSTSVAGGPIAYEIVDPSIGLRSDPELEAILSDITPRRLRETDSVLVSFGPRQTMSDTASDTRGIGAARRFIHQKLGEYSRDCNG